ncbi:mariner transposase [Plakobranchus ocellatus]|uniref:Mariner transposase n=1 Tax=Plakobranchus ocellatus TaxID=259542 RepID=A0AAV4A650_9GAST|nr:mariner transposase [Plakobranchus ocellatus]
MAKCADCAVRKWVRIFKGEDPRETILRDRKRCGRLLSASGTAHREKVDWMIRANRRVKQKESADEVGISKERVHRNVTTVLDYRKVSARWVPTQLTVEMKAQREDMCTRCRRRTFLQRILTRDESWVHHHNPECKAQSIEYRHKTSPSKEVQGCCLCKKGLVHRFLGHGGNGPHGISGARANCELIAIYFNTPSSQTQTRRVRRDKDSILQHGNARPHTSRQTQEALRQLELTTLPHPAYSPDLAPSDYHLFSQLKKYLKGHHYDNDEEVIADGVRQLSKRWRLCADRDGDYVEK